MRPAPTHVCIAILACSFVLAARLEQTRAASGWTPPPSWSPVNVDQVRVEVVSLLRGREPSAEQDKLIAQWEGLAETATPQNVLELVASTAASVNGEAAALVEACRHSFSGPALPDLAWLQDAELAEFFTKNLRLYAARWLLQEGFYNEAIDLIAALNPDDVVDPATLLYCKAVCHHQLVEVKPALVWAQKLLERAEELPVRYEQLATLISEDIQEVEDDSLDHIARRMNDVRRRLDHAQAGNQVVMIENGVIESLDKLLEELEEARKRQQQQQSGGGQAPTQPMQDSMLPQGMQGPGNVDRSDVGDKSGWGAIDDKEREEALQDIGREFPAHYRDVIEEYFKKIAAEDADGP
jgi:hypothetical protein